MTTNLKRAIAHLNDITELRELRKACVDRIGVLEERAYAKLVSAAWERVRVLEPGTVLYVCAKGTFFGGPFQRGDKLRIQRVGRRVIYAEHGEKGLYSFPPKMVERYDLRTEPPADPLSAEAREHVERVAGRVAESLA